MKIGSAIKLVRQARGVKLGIVANAAKISASFLSLVESGEREPSLEVVRKIADALSVPTEALIVLAQPIGGKLSSSNPKTSQLVNSIKRLADAEERLRQRLDEHGGGDASERSSP